MNIIKLTVTESDASERIDKYLTAQCADFTRSYIARLIDGGCVSVNNETAKANYRVCENDEIIMTVSPPQELDVSGEDIDIDVVYQDDELMVINKPLGMVVHPAAGNYSGTLVNAVMHHAKGKLSQINGIIRPGIVHRLDKDTTGLIVVAKTNRAHLSLSAQIKDKTCARRYWAIVHGNIKEDSIRIDAPIGRNPKNRKKMCVTDKSSREAVTLLRVLERFGDFTLVECSLETGRTHQIRVHMLHINHPVLGDDFYAQIKNRFNIHTQMLHAKELAFNHPVSGERMVFTCDPPEKFMKILNSLRTG